MAQTFSTLLSEHADLEQMFDKHQRALLARDIAVALGTITTFENALKQHIRYENEVILPLYVSKRAEIEGATLTIFHAEHRKLQEMTATLSRHTAELKTSADILGAIVKLFDEEALFKGLFSHHSLREENLLFPALDACTTEAEREKALRLAHA